MPTLAAVLAELPAKISRSVTANEGNDCWLWSGAVNSSGYGTVYLDKRSQYVHRVVYALTVGPLLPGYVIDHRCFERRCCNPAHLRLVTVKQNSEHRQGVRPTSISGVRNVKWHRRDQKWHVVVGHNRRSYRGGYFTSLADAEAAAIALRAKLFTHEH